jgi:pyrimidine operon attenuation protein/uracil phosphoribosyltransferase
MTNEKVLILTKKQIEQKLNRLAYQVYEDNFEEEEIVVAGIEPNGSVLASRLVKVLKKISNLTIKEIKISLDRKAPAAGEIELNTNSSELENKVVILVDDVLNSGRTIAYAQTALMNVRIKKLRTLVLVDRNHKRFPVATDFSGFSLSTVLQEHIEVNLDKAEEGVYLS